MADLAHAGVPMRPFAEYSKEDEEFCVSVFFASLKAMLTLWVKHVYIPRWRKSNTLSYRKYHSIFA